MTKEIKNILIIKPSSIGDIVQGLPVVGALRRGYPEAKISWLIRSEFAELIEGHRDLLEVIRFDRKCFGKAWYSPGAFSALMSFIRELRGKRFDLIIDLQGLFRTAALGWLSRCKERFGPASAREFGHVFYNHKVRQTADCIHVVDYYLKIAKAAGAAEGKADFVFPEDSAAEEAVDKLFSGEEICTENFVVFVPGSAHEDKCWPIERFAKLADKISSEFGTSVVAVGSKSEREIIERLKELTKVKIVNFAGLTSLRELPMLLKRAKLVVSNDTGPGHIAAALGVGLVLIFGRSNPARIIPYGREECAVGNDLKKRSLQKINSIDPNHSVEAVSFEQVYSKVCEQMRVRPDSLVR